MDACKTNVRVSLFRADLRARFVSGHDFSRAAKAANERALAPAALLYSPLNSGFGQRSGSSACRQDISFAAFNNYLVILEQ
jgi:hypothetical protein